MIDIANDIDSLSNFKRHTPEFIDRLKAGGRPVVLTVNGKPEVVVQDAAAFQKLIELAERGERAERLEALRASIDDMKAGRVTPADEMLAEMQAILAAKQGQ